ncbi:MAG: YihY/virulence factor BrkB family protein [Congregibacter sp.]
MQRLKTIANIFHRAGKYWLDSNAFANAGSLAFFTLFSIAPMLIVIVSIIGIFYGQEAALGQVSAQLEDLVGANAAETVEDAIERSRVGGDGVVATLSGLAAMLIGATTVFGQMQDSLNAIFGVAPKPSGNGIWLLLRKRLTSLTLILAVGFVMLVSLSLGVGLRLLVQSVQGWLPYYDVAFSAAESVLSIFLTSCLFAMIFRALPDVRLSWRDVALGAVLTAIMFTIGRILIALYLSFTATASAYGAAGSLVLLLLWVNYSSLILLFGAAFVRAHMDHRGVTLQPESIAVRVRKEIIED